MAELIPLNCPMCGGKLQREPAENRTSCPYCGTEFMVANQDMTRKTTPLNSILFLRCVESRESAFELQVPDGWLTVGGIFRSGMPMMMGAQSAPARLDFAVKDDVQGRVMLHWCPEMVFTDPRMNPAAMMGGMFPGAMPGIQPLPLFHPVDFLIQQVFPWAHPQAANVNVLHRQEMPILAQNYTQNTAAMGVPVLGNYAGGMVVFTYSEGGVTYRENAYAVIENMGPTLMGIWSNKDTFLERAPQDEFEQWQPIMAHIRDSAKLNPTWVSQELARQGFMGASGLDAQQQQRLREQQARNLQQELQSINQQIGGRRVSSAGQSNEYLNLMNLEEYINPFTRATETGSNQWRYRWVNQAGDEFYTDDASVDPNALHANNCSDWQSTPVRPRGQ